MPMRLFLGVVTAAPALVAAASVSIVPHCKSFMNEMEAEGHSNFEIGALCRSRLSPEVCQKAMAPLGKQPWSSEMVDTTCKVWDSEYQAQIQDMAPSRRAASTGELMKALDTATKMKAEAGICKNVTMDACAQQKAKEYPKQAQKVMDLMKKFQASWMSGKPMYPAAAKPARLYADDQEPMDAGMPAAGPIGTFVASGFLGGAVVMGVARLVQHRQHRGQREAASGPLVIE